jgi:hypothetical protein
MPGLSVTWVLSPDGLDGAGEAVRGASGEVEVVVEVDCGGAATLAIDGEGAAVLGVIGGGGAGVEVDPALVAGVCVEVALAAQPDNPVAIHSEASTVTSRPRVSATM